MLNLFKSNSPGVVVFYIFYIALFRAYVIFFPAQANLFSQHNEPLSRLAFSILNALNANGAFVSAALSGVSCFLQALLVNKLVNDNKILPRKNYLAGLVYIIVFSFFKENLVLNPVSLALTFIILSCMRLFALIRKEKAPGDIFDVGFLIAIAALFYFPCILFAVFVFFGIATVRPFEFREWFVALTGFITPFFMVLACYFYFDRAGLLIVDIANLQMRSRWMNGAGMNRVNSIVLGGLAAFTLAALAILPGALYSSLIQVRKYATILILLTALIAISFTLQQIVNLSHWAMLALPLSILFSIALMQIRNKLIVEVVHLMLILLVLTGQYLPLLNII